MRICFNAVLKPRFGMLYSLFVLGALAQSQAGKTVEQARTEASLLRLLKSVSMSTGKPGDVTPAGDAMRCLSLNVDQCELSDEQAALLRQYLTLALPQVRPIFIEEAVAVYDQVMANGTGGL